jgi:hypothetical protein
MNRSGLRRSRIGRTAVMLGCLSVAALISGCVAHPRRVVVYEPVPPAVGMFHDALSPYGEWILLEPYGRVWRPYPLAVGPEFTPYLTGGYWVNTDAGWSFETEWSWGWAPFHYGRWYRDSAFGWVWVPGTVWGPAWVDWRFGGGYVGWAPLPPHGAVVYTAYQTPWIFVTTQHFVERDFHRYSLPAAQVHSAYAVTQPVHPAGGNGAAQWHAGPPPGQVAAAVGHPVSSVPLSAAPPPPGVVHPVTAGSPHAARAPWGPPRSGHSSGSPPPPVGSAHPSAPPPAGAGHPSSPGAAPGTAAQPAHPAQPPSAQSEAAKPPPPTGTTVTPNPPPGHPASAVPER